MKIQYTDTNHIFINLLDIVKSEQLHICLDSREVKKGMVFVSLPALSKNEEKEKLQNQQIEYMKSAAKNGASFIVCEQEIAEKFIKEFPIAQNSVVQVEDVRLALGELASARYNTQNNNFPLVGITGTNGKTTLAFLLNFFLSNQGAQSKKIAMLGTVEYSYPNYKIEAPLTTPNCIFLHSFFHDAKNAGCDFALMEVSSHALEQERVAGLDYTTAIFTNLSQDHLDYHNSMDEYFEAKAKLFARADNQVINADDAYGQKLLERHNNAIAYTLDIAKKGDKNTVYGELINSTPNGLELKVFYNNKECLLKSLLIGKHNAYNILALIAFGMAHNYTLEDFLCIENFAGVSGRLERVVNSKNIHAFVDYAHTPDALVNVLQALRNAGFERIITIFGCGGDRDRTKRMPMAQAVSKYSDVAILTSDNPRTENPEQILDDTEQGLDKSKPFYRIADRKEAILFACQYIYKNENLNNSVLLIAGKGHENYQIIGTEKFPFSDQEIVRGL